MYGDLPYVCCVTQLILEGNLMGQKEYMDSEAPKRERLEARISAEQKELLQRAAALQGWSLSDFVVESAQRAAEATIREHSIIALSTRDSLMFMEAVLNPPPPTARLRAAAERYLDEVEER